MKIVIDARFYGVEHTGIGRYTINLLKQLQQIDKTNEYVVILLRKYFNSLKFSDGWSKELLDVRHYTLREQIGLLPIIRKHKPDVFHSLQLNVPYLFFGNQIVTIHDTTQLSVNTKATTLPLPLYWMKLLAIHVSFRKALTAKKIIVPTKVVKNDLVARGAKKKNIEVICEGFDSLGSSNIKKKQILKKYNLSENYFLYVGNAYPHKNIKRAIDAVIALNEKSKENIQLSLVSARSEFTEDLDTYIKKNNAGNLVKLLGYVPDENLQALYKYSTALFYPSMNEGFGLPGIEAMAAGAVVTASDIPVFKEVFGDAALYFNPKNVGDMTQSLRKVLELTTSQRKKLVAKGKKKSNEYSWKRMAKKTLQLYKQVN